MPAALQGHVHFDTSWPPSNTYVVSARGRYSAVPTIEASAAKTISGLLRMQVHSDMGVPVRYYNSKPTILVEGHAELAELLSHLGETMYYTENFHDDVSSAPGILYTRKVLFAGVDGIERSDPMEQFFDVTIELVDVYSKQGRIYDVNQGNLSYVTGTTLADTGQDFGDWDRGAGAPAYYAVITNTDGTIAYAYLGALVSATAIYIFKDAIGSLAGTAGTDISGHFPASYEIRKVAFG